MVRLAIEAALALLTLCGIAFHFVALWGARTFRRETGRPISATSRPAISILKPLKGADDRTYAALRSHCQQEYGSFEIIFGVNDAEDKAVPLVRKLIAEFPNLSVRLVICGEALGSNRKVSNLIYLLREASYSYILVNDGDISVSPHYLQAVVAGLDDPEVGMVTCLYRGNSAHTFGSKLEALGIATDFAPGVLTALFLDQGLSFGLGSTLVMRRAALEKIGSFDAVVDYLADDYQLGKRIADAGFKVVLSSEIVETAVPKYSLVQFWEHQLRWARTMRVSRPSGYAGVVFTFALPWAIFLMLVAPSSWWAWALLGAAFLARLAAAIGIGKRILGDRQVIRDLWLLPMRDLLGLAIWFCSYVGNTVVWRGEKFRLEGGRMYRISNASASEGESKNRVPS